MALNRMFLRLLKNGVSDRAKSHQFVTSRLLSGSRSVCSIIKDREQMTSKGKAAIKDEPEIEEDDTQFQGLETNFPCLAKQKNSAETLQKQAFTASQVNPRPVPDIDYVFEEIGMPDISEATEFHGLTSNFPCIASHDRAGPEPEYDNVVSGFKTYTISEPFPLRYRKGVLPEVTIAYETWGTLNANRDNVILISTGLSASSHVRSHEENVKKGWWERFVGPGCAIDTDKFFVICTNNLGGCYGTTGPSSINPVTGKPYATTFPIVSLDDMIKLQFRLLDNLGIEKVYATVGASLGGMLSVAGGIAYPERVNRVVTISACIQSHPTSIAMRYLQRKAIMLDPNWQHGHYYNTGKYPVMGMKLAREVATLSYRSGIEWEERFGRSKISEEEPSLCPHFMIENYLDYQGESFCMKMDPNTLLYTSKAMDLFDLRDIYGSNQAAMSRIKCPVLVMGATSDILFPIRQQREISTLLQQSGNDAVTYFELNSMYGHDTFLLELNTVGTGIKGFLETDMKEKGRASKRKDRKSV